MRFISMVKSTESRSGPPPKALMEAMDQLVKDAAKAGCVMVEAGRPVADRRTARASGFPEAS